jgi:hypothetical protein
MATRYIKHIALIGLKYFFNIDQNFCHHCSTIFFLSLACVKFTWFRVTDEFAAGVYTVKDDITQVKYLLNEVKEHLPVREFAHTLFTHS